MRAGLSVESRGLRIRWLDNRAAGAQRFRISDVHPRQCPHSRLDCRSRVWGGHEVIIEVLGGEMDGQSDDSGLAILPARRPVMESPNSEIRYENGAPGPEEFRI